jgi:hypothetical protein
MYTPQFTITSKILRNIGNLEYSKAIIENTVVLHTWENQLQKEARVKFIGATLSTAGINADLDTVKKAMDTPNNKAGPEIQNINETINLVYDMARNRQLDELDLKYIHKSITKDILPKVKQGVYRNNKSDGSTDPEEILADIVETFDWLNSIDGQETHPAILAGIVKYQIDHIAPFDSYNSSVGDLAALLVLKTLNYTLKDFVNCAGYGRNQHDLRNRVIANKNSKNCTQWLETYIENFASEAINVQEKVKLLAKDTKIAKVSGRATLSPRQERIVEYIQDYGLVQNRDFPALFPNKSEDSILRDLKVLIDKKIIKKVGSTKSSHYELAA